MSESDNTRPSTSAGRPEQAQPVRSMMVPDLSKPKPDHITAEHRVLLAQRKKRDRAARVLRRALAVLQVGIIVHSEAVYPLINSNPELNTASPTSSSRSQIRIQDGHLEHSKSAEPSLVSFLMGAQPASARNYRPRTTEHGEMSDFALRAQTAWVIKAEKRARKLRRARDQLYEAIRSNQPRERQN